MLIVFEFNGTKFEVEESWVSKNLRIETREYPFFICWINSEESEQEQIRKEYNGGLINEFIKRHSGAIDKGIEVWKRAEKLKSFE